MAVQHHHKAHSQISTVLTPPNRFPHPHSVSADSRGRMEHDKASRPLTLDEFDGMMQEFDLAQTWMLEQLMSRRMEDDELASSAAKNSNE